MSENSEKEKISMTDEKENKQVNLLEIEIKDENTALNVIVGFLGLAQRRGAFAINESAKLFEAIKQFKSVE
tara:strand:+ start:2768 stop:2980 length:213 start_codon:yes stop_codon:yes gene_type:complete